MNSENRDLVGELQRHAEGTEQESPPVGEAPAGVCALSQQLSCCDGVGYRLDASGAQTRAVLCSCLANCPACFGRARRLEKGFSVPCHEPNPARIVNLLNGAGLPSRYAGARLETFSNFTGNGREMVAALGQWLASFDPDSSRGLVIGGSVGVGKTYILAALCKNLAAKGYTVRFVDFFQLLNDLKDAYSSNKADESLLRPLIDGDVLMIDELGKGRNNDWEQSVLDQLVTRRYNQRKLIIATTNFSLQSEERVHWGQKNLDEGSSSFRDFQFDSLESRVGQRIYSRLVEESDFIELTGHDFRQRQAEQDRSGLFAALAPPGAGGPAL